MQKLTGVVDNVNIRVGELFTGSPLAGITIINPSALKATVDVPENYVSRITQGYACCGGCAGPWKIIQYTGFPDQ